MLFIDAGNQRTIQYNQVLSVNQELLDNTVYVNGVDPTYLVCQVLPPSNAPTVTLTPPQPFQPTVILRLANLHGPIP